MAIESTLDEGWFGLLKPIDYRRVGIFYNRLLYSSPPERIPAGVLGAFDREAAQTSYKNGQIAVIDSLLSATAIAALRQWCMESTIFFDANPQGYVGAYFEEGFTSPLLLQVIEELKAAFPKVLGPHRLNEAWAYKYDSTGKGIKTHADTAAVNLNLWVTPDSANLDPNSGGLVVFKKEAPLHWDFSEFNSPKGLPKMEAFLKGSEQANFVLYSFHFFCFHFFYVLCF